MNQTACSKDQTGLVPSLQAVPSWHNGFYVYCRRKLPSSAPYFFRRDEILTTSRLQLRRRANVFSGEKPVAPRLRELLNRGERISFGTLVLFAWRRGPRMRNKLMLRRRYSHPAKLFPSDRGRRFWRRMSTPRSNGLAEGKSISLLPRVRSLTTRSSGR